MQDDANKKGFDPISVALVIRWTILAGAIAYSVYKSYF